MNDITTIFNFIDNFFYTRSSFTYNHCYYITIFASYIRFRFNITLTTDGDAEDLTIGVTGDTNSSLILSSTGTGADALQVTTSAGRMDITSAGVMDITTSAVICM